MRLSMNSKAIRAVPGGIELRVKVVPGSSRTRIVGWLGDELKIQVAAPAEKGKANAAAENMLAETLKCPRRSVSVVQGQNSPRKTIVIRGITGEEVSARLKVV